MLFWLPETFNEASSLISRERYSKIRVEQSCLFITFPAGRVTDAMLTSSLLPGVAHSSDLPLTFPVKAAVLSFVSVVLPHAE